MAPLSCRGVESKNRRNRNGTTVFRRFIESKRSHFACMAEGNAALRAFACFSPVTLSENPFARPFSRCSTLAPRSTVSRHSPPLLFLFFFFFFMRISHREGRTITRFSFQRAWNERTTRWLDLDYLFFENFRTQAIFFLFLIILFENRILIHVKFSLNPKMFKYDKIVISGYS